MVEFMLASVCRVGEVHRLNLKDIDFENRSACVAKKKNKITNKSVRETVLSVQLLR